MEYLSQEEEVLWHATPEVKAQRLQRFTVALDQQGPFESERLWQLVSTAIKNDDQVKDSSLLLYLLNTSHGSLMEGVTRIVAL